MSTVSLLEKSKPDEKYQLHYGPTSLNGEEGGQELLIFMITGNPGLISFYEPFLSTLQTLLASSASRFYISGYSLAGFHASESDPEGSQSSLVGLEGQIDHIEQKLFEKVDDLRGAENNSPKVILIGHSVGAYILLELIRQHQTKVDGGQKDFDLIGGILLFPTITHIAQSPQGMIYNRILRIPHFPSIAGAFVKLMFYLIPTAIVYNIVKVVMQYPEHAARVTASFIKSPVAIRQALYLAKDEMETINEDKWGEEVWGAATSPGTNSRDTAHSNLILYWGKNDKLVADHTRDKLIDERASKGTQRPSQDLQPTMLIDELRIPHAFCLKHSETVAEKVKSWVEKVVEVHNQQCSSPFLKAA